MSIVSRAYTYYRRNGWTRSMKMLGRKVRGNAIPRAIIFAREFETIETRARQMVANPGAKKIKAVSPHAPGITDVEPRMTRGVVAVIGDLNLAQCKKYRVMQKLEVFEQLGLKADYSYYNDMSRSLNLLQVASIVIIYRMKAGTEFNLYLREARRLGVPIGYDIDDPIFDQEIYSDNPNMKFLARRERKGLLFNTRDYTAAVAACDFAIASTPVLADLLRRHVPDVYLWRNALDAEAQHFASIARRDRTPWRPGHLTICYCSGSRAHEADFRVIENVIEKVLEKHTQVHFLVIGYLNMPESLKKFGARLSMLPYGSYAGYLYALAGVDLNLVPLVDDGFNACKSAIRYLDAAAVEVATIASRVGDYVDVVRDGDNGLLAGSESEWLEKIDLMLSDDAARTAMAARALRSSHEEQSTQAIGAGLPEKLRGMFSGAAS